MSVVLSRKLESNLKPDLESANEVHIAVAIMTNYGLEFLRNHVPKNAKIKLLIGIDLLTPVSVFEELLNSPPNTWEIKVFRKKAYFHTKLYIINNKNPVCYVGSGNFTEGGISKHVEIFARLEGDNVNDFQDWFNQYFEFGETITQEFIDEYKPLFKRTANSQSNANRALRNLKCDLLDTDDPNSIVLEDIDFTSQFFKYEHYNAFSGGKPYSPSEEVNQERFVVRQKLFDLHDLLYPKIKSKGWDLHKHGDPEHIVSSFKHGIYTAEDLGAVWLHYGRSPNDLAKFKKVYGANQSSRFQMRLQVLVREKELAIWLTVGKNGGAVVDRENFKRKMLESSAYRLKFFNLLTSLPDPYFIEVNGEPLFVSEFGDENELYNYIKHDDIHQHYFVIGRSYFLGNQEIYKNRIVDTIISEFGMLYPIYLHLRTVLK